MALAAEVAEVVAMLFLALLHRPALQTAAMEIRPGQFCVQEQCPDGARVDDAERCIAPPVSV